MQNKANKITTIPSIIVTLAGGYIFDIFGRQMTLFTMIVFSGFVLVLYPIVSPSGTLYILCSCLYNLIISPITNNPLVQDYCVKESRGQAVSFSMMGLYLGVIMSLSVLFEFSKDIDPVIAWGLMSVIQISFGISVLWIVKDPVVIADKENSLTRIPYLT